jgi:hypothetical protein
MRTALLMLLFLTTASPVLAGPHRGNRRRVGTCSVGLPARSVGPDPMDRASPGVCPSGERGGDRRRCNGIWRKRQPRAPIRRAIQHVGAAS